MMTFDITDGRNRYQPCPRCLAGIGMGLSVKAGTLAVECAYCGFRGPEISGVPGSAETDRAAFDGWNAVPRSQSVQR